MIDVPPALGALGIPSAGLTAVLTGTPTWGAMLVLAMAIIAWVLVYSPVVEVLGRRSELKMLLAYKIAATERPADHSARDRLSRRRWLRRRRRRKSLGVDR